MAGRRGNHGATDEVNGSLRGNRRLKPIKHLIERLHLVGTERDRAGNRELFFDQYAGLLILSFFNPSLTSLRALQKATGGEQTRKIARSRGRSPQGTDRR